jgi:hypothetical protein
VNVRGLIARALTVPLLLAAASGRAAAQQDSVRDRVSERVVGARSMVDRLSEMVERRLGLTSDQSAKLRDATARYAAERQQLFRQERTLRRDLREELARGEAVRQERVASMLDRLLGLQRERADLVSAEQRTLSGFLSPVQRAEFLAMQERAFRAAQQMRQEREGRGEGRGKGPDKGRGRPGS